MIKVGIRVTHTKFGSGVIHSIRGDSRHICEIKFDREDRQALHNSSGWEGNKADPDRKYWDFTIDGDAQQLLLTTGVEPPTIIDNDDDEDIESFYQEMLNV